MCRSNRFRAASRTGCTDRIPNVGRFGEIRKIIRRFDRKFALQAVHAQDFVSEDGEGRGIRLATQHEERTDILKYLRETALRQPRIKGQKCSASFQNRQYRNYRLG